MTVVWKMELKPGKETYQLPAMARLISVAMQRGAPCVWFTCEPSDPKEERCILLTGTGHDLELPDQGAEWEYIGTMLTDDQAFVFHVFEQAELPF